MNVCVHAHAKERKQKTFLQDLIESIYLAIRI